MCSSPAGLVSLVPRWLDVWWRSAQKVTLVDSVIPEHGRDLFNIQDIRDQLIVDLNDVRDAGAMATKLKGRDFLFSPSGRTSHLDSITDPFSRMLTSG